LCVAIRRNIFCYKLTHDHRNGFQYKKIQEICLNSQPQFMSLTSLSPDNPPELLMGSQEGFTIHHLSNQSYASGPPRTLLHVKNTESSLTTLLSNPSLTHPMDALCCVDLGPEYKEFLLCFSKFGIYVSYTSERARQSEIMWPTQDRINFCQMGSNFKINQIGSCYTVFNILRIGNDLAPIWLKFSGF
jgi:hypothetical protein